MNENTIGEFTWSFGQQFFIETNVGNFVWNDPSYGGDDSIKIFNGSYRDWCKSVGIPHGRDKGAHRVIDYVGHINVSVK